MRTEVVLYAPNVHTGGGIVLLNALLAAWPAGKPLRAFLDIRALEQLTLTDTTAVTWVDPRVISRLRAEYMATQAVNRKGVVLLCFHGLPPLFPVQGDVVVFVQNRLLIERGTLDAYPFRVRMRIRVERMWSRELQYRCKRYIVQTPSMAALLKHWLRSKVELSITPFISVDALGANGNVQSSDRKFDFVYVASGEVHKNHRVLVDAWRLLAAEGVSPSLALTINPILYPALSEYIDRNVDEGGLKINNLGDMPSSHMAALYKSSKAMIFPSKVESFGLPLVEADRFGLPIIASELDYVRDIVCPVETFDPDSPISIARAVRRFLKNPAAVTAIGSAEHFLAEACK